METGLEKLNRMIEEEMEEHTMTVEQMLECIPDEICDYANIVDEKKIYYWAKDNSDEFKSHLKHHK
jgi:hypothetical protein